jgi:nicotinamidase-related amidase
MSVANQTLDRGMRELVSRRMRPTIAYSSADTALILVAPQTDLLTGEVSRGVASLLRGARGTGIAVLYSPLAPPTEGRRLLAPSQKAILDAALLESGSPGAQIHPDLAAEHDDIVLEPFTSLSAFVNPALLATLVDRELHRVIIAGARTDIEVDSTARDATEAGLHTTVISDCCTGSSLDRHQASVNITLPRLIHAVLTLADLPKFGIPLAAIPHG